MPGQATTGLSPEQFDELVTRVGERIAWESGRGRPRRLSLRHAVKAVVMYFRTNVSEELIAELVFVHQATISRTISRLEGVIAEVLAEFVPDPKDVLRGGTTLVDGSLCPCWSWADQQDLYSGKQRRTGHGHQFAADPSGRLAYISDPLPGKTHDATAVRATPLTDRLATGDVVADKGYVGTGAITPFKKPPGGELLDWQKEFNTVLNQIRWVIERVIANFKTWRCMHTDYRRPERTYTAAFRAVRALHFFKLAFA